MQSQPDTVGACLGEVKTRDDFSDERPAGQVIGSCTYTSEPRLGIDREGLLAIDHGALRIGCPSRPGWGRHGIAYGPFERTSGLAFLVRILNGHNNSQTAAIRHWTDHAKRVVWRVRRTGRLLLGRLGAGALPAAGPNHYFWPPVKDNLAIGWYGLPRPPRPHRVGPGFVFHGTGTSNGEVRALVCGKPLTVFAGLQNIPVAAMIVLRDSGAVYYLGTLPDIRGLPAFPGLSPVAIDPSPTPRTVFAGIHQAILGEIGFRVDTRVYGVGFCEPREPSPFALAHAADDLRGDGPLHGRISHSGITWNDADGSFRLTERGATATARDGVALLTAPGPTGLIHAVIEPRGQPIGLAWRALDAANYWLVRVIGPGIEVSQSINGSLQRIASGSLGRLRGRKPLHLQLVDSGHTVRVVMDGQVVVDGVHADEGQDARGVGVGVWGATEPGKGLIRTFEAHPRIIRAPSDIAPFWAPSGTQELLRDQFAGLCGPLDDRIVPGTDRRWIRALGQGRFEITGQGEVRVCATRAAPNPGRTAYVIDWSNAEGVEVVVQIIPPGTRPGDGELGRGGILIGQDDDTYLIVNNWFDDQFAGASLSSFHRVEGHEELRRAVWTNCGKRIRRGMAHTLSVVCDGNRYLARIDGEPVLFRAITDVYPSARRMRICRVGLVANWEFGDDTGTRFRSFQAAPLSGKFE